MRAKIAFKQITSSVFSMRTLLIYINSICYDLLSIVAHSKNFGKHGIIF